jgi:ATP-dependent Clp protease ATP-binding subunit ClpA
VDEIICFNQLTEENFAAISVLMLGELKDALAARNISLTWAEDVPALLVKKGYSAVYGARNLRRLIQKEIEDPAAEAVIAFTASNPDTPASAVSLSTADDQIQIQIS